jgi:hypothetical protein
MSEMMHKESSDIIALFIAKRTRSNTDIPLAFRIEA